MAYDEELAERVRALLIFEPDVVEKKMFGGLAFLIGGHIAVGVSEHRRAAHAVPSPTRPRSCSHTPHVEPFVMRGRAMNGWVRVGEDGVARATTSSSAGSSPAWGTRRSLAAPSG